MFFTFSIDFQIYFCTQGEMIDLLAFFFKFILSHILIIWNNKKMHFLHPDHFPVEVKIYFIWVAKKNQNRKLSFWRWDSNVPKILNSSFLHKESVQVSPV